MSKRKTVRPGVREISPVSIYGDVYGAKDLRKRCVLSLEWKREGVIDGDRCDDDGVDLTCVGWWEGERPGCGWGSRKEWGSLFVYYYIADVKCNTNQVGNYKIHFRVILREFSRSTSYRHSLSLHCTESLFPHKCTLSPRYNTCRHTSAN